MISVLQGIVTETKSRYLTYLVNQPPDREWKMSAIYTCDDVKIIDYACSLHCSNPIHINIHHLISSIQPLFTEKLTPTNTLIQNIPSHMLHVNVQAILVFIEPIVNHIVLTELQLYAFSVHLMKSYVDSLIYETDISIGKLITKMKSPVNEIVCHITKPDIIKKASVSLAVIVNDLIDIYKIKRNRFKLSRDEVNIHSVLSDIKEIVDFQYIIDDDVPELLYIDIKRIKQTILNLVNQNSQVYVNSSITIDLNDEDEDSFFYRIEFDIEKAELPIDERLYITKKIISMMKGEITIKDGNVRFTIEACKDKLTYSSTTLKNLKDKKILIVDNNESRRIDLWTRLRRWQIDVYLASNETEGRLMLDKHFDLIIVGISSMVEKINRLGAARTYVYLVDVRSVDVRSVDISETRDTNSCDTTPVNSPASTPRIRRSSVTRTNILFYPTDDAKLISCVIEHI